MWTAKDILTMARFDGLIEYKTKYKGHTVYEPFTNKPLALGLPRYYLTKGDEFKSVILKPIKKSEYEIIEKFLKEHDEIACKHEVGVNVFIDED